MLPRIIAESGGGLQSGVFTAAWAVVEMQPVCREGVGAWRCCMAVDHALSQGRRPFGKGRNIHRQSGQLNNPVLARVTGAKQLTLPDEVLASFPGVDRFNVSEEGGRIVLTPVQASPLDAVRRKLAALGITEEDVRDAVAWARLR